MSTQTLYEIHSDLAALEDLLLETGGDVTDADTEAAIDAWLSETGEAVAAKLDRYAALIREMEERSESRKVEADRLSQLASADANAAKRLKDRLHWFCTEHGLTKVDTARFRISVAGNGGKTPIRLSVEPDALPVAYRIETVVRKADMEAIREALEAGESLSFAEMLPRGSHLRIR